MTGSATSFAVDPGRWNSFIWSPRFYAVSRIAAYFRFDFGAVSAGVKQLNVGFASSKR